jgi:flagellin
MTTINTNVASLIGLNNLNNANNQLQTSLTRLSTGLQINSGADNPAGLVASNQLTSQLAAINQSISNSNAANNVLSTADASLSQISGLLNQIRSLVQAGLNSGANSPTELQADQNQIDQALTAINQTAANTSFAGDQLIDGSKAYTTQVSSGDTSKFNSYSINSVAFSGNATVPISTDVTQAATKGTLYYNFVAGGLATQTAINVSGANGTNVVFLGKGSSISDVKSAVNAVTDVTGVGVTETAAVESSTTFGTAGSNNGLVFNDVRGASTGQGSSFAQSIDVQFATATANQNLSVSSASSSTEITLTVTLGTDGTGTVTSTASDVKALINSSANSSGYVAVSLEGTGAGTVTAAQSAALSGGVNGYLTFQSTDFGSSQFVGLQALQGTFATTEGAATGTDAVAASRDVGTDIQATINGQQAVGDGLTASVTGEDLNASVTFNTSANVANTTGTITVTGGGAVFQIGQNVNLAGQVNIGIPAINTAELGGTEGKLYQLGSGGGLSLIDVNASGSTVSGATLVDIINDAINQVSTLSGQIGAVQSNVIDTNIATLNSALENVSQANSNIEDTNFASETSNLTRAQILEQSGISVLSIANQTPQNVLKLLQNA